MKEHAKTLATSRTSSGRTTPSPCVAWHPSRLAVAIAGALAFGMQSGVQAGVFPAEVDLSSLDGNNGVIFFGEATADRVGYSASSAGDVNGDGIDDLIIGAYSADPSGSFSGRTYVVFGSADGLASPFKLSTLDGSNGFAIDGEGGSDLSGISVSGAGDINGDGIDDLIIGAIGVDVGGNESAGRSYVVFGSGGGFPDPLDLSTIDGTNGFLLNGAAADDDSGLPVGAAGDLNGDGIDDLIIGAVPSSPGGNPEAGRVYVVFGSNSGLPNPFNLATIDGTNGIVINGASAGDDTGQSLDGAGDVNGDGTDDLIIGAPGAGPGGRAYVVFGSTSGLPNPLNLSGLGDPFGVVIEGAAPDDDAGQSVSAAGDINHDGIDDLIIGAPSASPNQTDGAGRSFVVFGSATSLQSPIQLADLNGLNGFTLNGEAASDASGLSVSEGGDLNGDGIDDLIIGAWRSDSAGYDAGRAYVIYGSDSQLPNPLNLATLDGDRGFVINGEVAEDLAGLPVSSAGDFNGDGIDDLLTSALDADSGGNESSGRSYLLFGRGDGLFSDRFEDE